MRLSNLSLAVPAALFALISALAPRAAQAEPEERLEVVDRSIAHHGGELYRASETQLELCSKSGCSQVRSRVDGDLFEYRVVADVRGTERTVRVSNAGVELWENDLPVEVAAGDAQRLRDWAMARVYFDFLPYRLNDPSVFKEDLGLETWDGRELHKVKVTFQPGTSTDADDEYLYWFDPTTARLEQFAYSYAGRPGGLRFRRGLNYRRVGGILFFDQENLGVEGEGLSVDLVTPEYVAEKMRLVSNVTLRDIEVSPLR